MDVQDTLAPTNVSHPAHAFAGAHFPLLQQAQFQPEHARLANVTPIVTVCWALTGSFILLSGFFVDSAGNAIKTAGVVVLLLAIPIFLAERLYHANRIRRKMQARRPAVEEIAALRSKLSEYLTDLDRRTSRYFHCVTNTKVVTYFMLRQIENALGELLNRIDRIVSHATADNQFRLEKALRGTLEYRDGFAFNSGQVHHTPMHLLPARIQELVTDLEKGIAALEEEIDLYRTQTAVSAHTQEPTETPSNQPSGDENADGTTPPPQDDWVI